MSGETDEDDKKKAEDRPKEKDSILTGDLRKMSESLADKLKIAKDKSDFAVTNLGVQILEKHNKSKLKDLEDYYTKNKDLAENIKDSFKDESEIKDFQNRLASGRCQS